MFRNLNQTFLKITILTYKNGVQQPKHQKTILYLTVKIFVSHIVAREIFSFPKTYYVIHHKMTRTYSA